MFILKNYSEIENRKHKFIDADAHLVLACANWVHFVGTNLDRVTIEEQHRNIHVIVHTTQFH